MGSVQHNCLARHSFHTCDHTDQKKVLFIIASLISIEAAAESIPYFWREEGSSNSIHPVVGVEDGSLLGVPFIQGLGARQNAFHYCASLQWYSGLSAPAQARTA